ncbi:MAG: DUF4984 domain-containing protein [Bacteroidales bacterium]
MFKHNLLAISSVCIILLAVFSSCDSEPIYYDDAEYVMFSDSVAVVPVVTDEEYIDFHIASTVSRPYDRHFAVEVLENQSNVVEGFHYEIENPNVFIKAGEKSGTIRIKGLYDNVRSTDSLSLQLRLLASDEVISDLYGDRMRVMFQKCYPLNIDDYTGNLLMYASFPFSSSIKTYLRKAEKRTENSLVISAPFSYGYDMILYFDGSDPLYPLVTVKEHYSMIDTNYGKVSARTVDHTPSFFDGENRRIYLKMEFYVRGMGNFGVNGFVFEWITPEEAELFENGIL